MEREGKRMLVKIILIILTVGFLYTVGVDDGERRTLTRVKSYIKISKNWDEFMEMLSVDFNKNNIEVWDETTGSR